MLEIKRGPDTADSFASFYNAKTIRFFPDFGIQVYQGWTHFISHGKEKIV